MDKLRFDFKMRGTADGKSTILCLTSIGTPDGHTFAVQDEYQPITLHKELMKSQVYNRVKNTLKKRNQFRKVWITMTEDLKKVYVDDDDNLLFADLYLEEILEEGDKSIVSTSDTLTKLLEKIFESKQQSSEIKNLQKNC